MGEFHPLFQSYPYLVGKTLILRHLIVALIIGEVVDEPIYVDVPIVRGLHVIGAIAAIHYLNSFLSFHFPAFDDLTAGKPRLMIEDGTTLESQDV